MRTLSLFLALFLSSTTTFAQNNGVLIIAHGVTNHGDHGGGHKSDDHHHPDPWEEAVKEVAENAARRLKQPVELAFGMWNRTSFQKGVDQLSAKGVTELRVVPLFISSHSDVIRAQHFMFHLRAENPLPFPIEQLALPSQMTVSFSTALDDAPELSAILDDRARALTQNATREEIILVAHGPTSEDDDRLWLETLNTHASRLTTGQPIHVITVRDDADPADKEEMTRRLRAIVQGITDRGNTACVLPVLLASGGIEKGVLERLNGLNYRYQGKMLAPDPRLADWVVRMSR